MPLGVIGSLSIAIVLYVSSSLMITGMVNFKDLISYTPFVDAFSDRQVYWIAAIIGTGSLLSMITTILSSLLGLPRILYQMARDGLLFDIFARLNRFRVPYMGTIIIAVISCVLTIFLDFSVLSEMISCGVLINYTLIDVGVIVVRFMDTEQKIELKHYLTLLGTFLSCVLFGIAVEFSHPIFTPLCILPFMAMMGVMYYVMPVKLLRHPPNVESFLCPLVPFLPCVGILLNVAMLVQLELKPLVQVVGWLLIGSIFYFAYGIRNSKLNFTDPKNDRFYY